MATYLAATQYLQKAAIDKLLAKADTAKPAAVYLAAFTGSPGESGLFASEVIGGGYGRQSITAKLSAFAFSGQTTESALTSFVQFPVATAAWGTITYIAIVDAVTGGNILWYGELTTPRVIVAGSSPLQFVSGSLTLRIRSGNMTSYALTSIGDHFIGKTTWTMPTACKMHLFTANPTAAGSFANQADYGSYAAIEVTSKMAATVLATGVAVNSAAVTFATPSSGPNIIGYTGISDGAGSPVLLIFGPLRHEFAVNNGDSIGPLFKIGSVAAQMT